ncbi:MAG: hypothetical protein ACREQ9_07235 [Candidatus Binatia bacterium]
MNQPTSQIPLQIPDTTVQPSQYFRRRASSVLTGERRLLASVLKDALDTIRRTAGSSRPRDRKLGREATRWLYSEETSSVLRFRTICELLDIDAHRVRMAVAKWQLRRCRGRAVLRSRRVRS